MNIRTRLIALLLVIATMLSLMGSAAPVVAMDDSNAPAVTVAPVSTPEVTPEVNEEIVVEAETVNEAPETEEPAGCDNEKCTCDPCTCEVCACNGTIWDRVQEAEDLYNIVAFPDQSAESIVFFNENVVEYALSPAECPAYLFVTVAHKDADGNTLIYEVDTLDESFWDEVVGRYFYVEASAFSAVVPIAGTYATISPDAGDIFLFKNLTEATNLKRTTADKLSGEYVVADYTYAEDIYGENNGDWFIKLVPDEAWPVDANYTWLPMSAVANLSHTPTRVPEEPACDICGKTDCDGNHKQCHACPEYDCTKTHIYCITCGNYDCGKVHATCPVCGTKDCAQTHENAYYNLTAPVIPEGVQFELTDELTISDEKGAAIPETGIVLGAGMQRSLSAWFNFDGNADVSYQWQIRYDHEDDLWANIHGETEQGILFSAAMLMSVADANNIAYLRCVATVGEETRTAAFVPVVLQTRSAVKTSAAGSSISLPAAQADGDENLSVQYVVVQYTFEDGKTAAAQDFATVIPGQGHAHDYDVPSVVGYYPELQTHSFGDGAKIDGDKLKVNLTGEQLQQEYTILQIIYKPAYVNYTVIHYLQKANEDGYDMVLEESRNDRRTGETISNVHKTDYSGFYYQLYRTPAAAADGKTVVEVYYDRYYYLMNFELDDGYGVYPIYNRYESTIDISDPVKPGYTFLGWFDGPGDNAQPASIPATMPDENRTYYAHWSADNTEYSVVYWIENDDNTKTYLGTKIVGAHTGDKVSGSDDLTIETNACGMGEHTHGSGCSMSCALTEHTHGTDCRYTCGKDEHDHKSGCSCNTTLCTNHTRSCYVFTNNSRIAESASNVSPYYQASYNNLEVYRQNKYGNSYYSGDYYVKIGNSYYRITNGTNNLNDTLKHTMTCHVEHTSSCCTIEAHTHDPEQCCRLTEHLHEAGCYSCELLVHTHSEKCKASLAPYVEFKRADQNVTVEGDGSTTVNVYYEYKTYVIRFIYARKNGNNYQVANSTSDGNMSNMSWNYGINQSQLPTVTDPDGYNGRTVKLTVGTNTSTYYYVSVTAKFGENIADRWPDTNIGNAGSYIWGSWGAEYGSGYRNTYGNAHANIVGPYPFMSADMIVQGRESEYVETLADGTRVYLAQNMVAWWAKSDDNVSNHAYHNYFEVLEDVDQSLIDGVNYIRYDNGKVYRLEQTYTFTAAHNGSTRVDPIFYSGYTCINDTAGKDPDPQGNSKNFNNDGKCTICGQNCNYCNDFFYDRDRYTLYFWNHNGYLREGSGADVAYGESLSKYGNYVNETFMDLPENYPENLEPNGYSFEGWYTTAECLEGTEVNWDSTMPAANMTVYAKWEPVEHVVNFYLDRAQLNAGVTIPEQLNREPYFSEFSQKQVHHGEKLPELDNPGVAEGDELYHPYAGYTFVGWFYLNENGREVAFDPANIAVTRDMNLFAKWGNTTLCYYNVYFALDNNGDGNPDTNADGDIIYVADSISGSSLVGTTYTFNAKGGDDLYEGYRNGFFPSVSSHSITIDGRDEDGVSYNTYIFLYKEKVAVPYTVKYYDTATNAPIVVDGAAMADKIVSGNRSVVVTENFVYIPKYMPDAYQKTLVVSGNEADADKNVIIFYYTKDIEHALYVVNHYIETLDSSLNHSGWIQYSQPLQNTGVIDDEYSASALSINGFALSESYTNLYNRTDKKNPVTNKDLPADVSKLNNGELKGKLGEEGMELNFYYTRNLYPYEFRYMLNGTLTKVKPSEIGKAGFDTVIPGSASNIIAVMLDKDGNITLDQAAKATEVEYRLVDTSATKTITVRADGDPLAKDAVVTSGQATINIATFYYERCTQDLKVTKQVENSLAANEPNKEFSFTVKYNNSVEGYHQLRYSYIKSDGTSGFLAYDLATPDTLKFTLKPGQTITIQGLPTGSYTVTEADYTEDGYIADLNSTEVGNQQSKNVQLTRSAAAEVIAVNTYQPARLAVKKNVESVEDDNNHPVRTAFTFYVDLPVGSAAGEYEYIKTDERGNTVGTYTVYSVLTGGRQRLTIELMKGQTATFNALHPGVATITEEDYSTDGYNAYYKVNDGQMTEGQGVSVTLVRKQLANVEFINKFPVGDLKIIKYIGKEFGNDEWGGDTFTFTVKRTDKNLNTGNEYAVWVSGDKNSESYYAVGEDGHLTVTITVDANETSDFVVIKNLPAGTYEVVETADDNYNPSPEEGKVSGIVIPSTTNGGVALAEFTNQMKRHYGNLSITKTVERENSIEIPAEDQRDYFKFYITLPGDPDYKADVTVAYGNAAGDRLTTVPYTNGKGYEVSVAENETVTLIGLPAVAYFVAEEDVSQWHYDSQLINNEGTIPKNGTVAVSCINKYPVRLGKLTVTKSITNWQNLPAGEDSHFVFRISGNGVDMSVTMSAQDVVNNGGSYSITISEMPMGTYTIEEDTSWSWRYTCNNGATKTVTLAANNRDGAAEFKNTFNQSKWLTSTHVVKNVFTATSNPNTNS